MSNQQIAEIKTGAENSPPTALDVALKKTKPSEHPLTDHVARELKRTQGKKEFPAEASRAPAFINRKQFIEWLQFQPTNVPIVATAEEVEFLRGEQSQVERLVAEMEIYSLTNVNKRLFAMRDAHAAAIEAGQNTATTHLMPGRDEVTKDSRHQLDVRLGLLRQRIHEKVVPVAKAILERFVDVVFDFMRNTEIRDREACTIQGIEFVASAEWRAAASIVISHTPESRLPKPWAWATPKSILEGIVEL
jgi:hypothetical protein